MQSQLRALTQRLRRAAPARIVLFEGGEGGTRQFLRGLLLGLATALGAVLLMAPNRANANLLEEAARQREIAEEANDRARQAATVAQMCVSTAQDLQHTLTRYQELLAE